MREAQLGSLPCAVKTGTPALLRREAEILSGLHHMHVVQLLRFCEDDNAAPTLWLQHCGEHTLYDIVSSNLPRRQLIDRLLVHTARGVAHLHEKRVAHLDLKPENVVVDASGCARIVDFGLAAKFKEGEEDSIARFQGTACYVPPEMGKGHRIRAFPCDVWAFGVIFFVCMHSRMPWKGMEHDDDGMLYRFAFLQKHGGLSPVECLHALYPTLDTLPRKQPPRRHDHAILNGTLGVTPGERSDIHSVLSVLEAAGSRRN